MDLQYLSDADGKHTAVVIPIEDWRDLTTKHEELKKLEQKSKSLNVGQDESSAEHIEMPLRKMGSLKKLGELQGKTFSIPDNFNDPLEDLKDYM